jgi:hypothetical protein
MQTLRIVSEEQQYQLQLLQQQAGVLRKQAEQDEKRSSREETLVTVMLVMLVTVIEWPDLYADYPAHSAKLVHFYHTTMRHQAGV